MLYQTLTSNKTYVMKSSVPLCWLPNSYQILNRQARALKGGCTATMRQPWCAHVGVCASACRSRRVFTAGWMLKASERTRKPTRSALHSHHLQLPPEADVPWEAEQEGKELDEVLSAATLPLKLTGCQGWAVNKPKPLSPTCNVAC